MNNCTIFIQMQKIKPLKENYVVGILSTARKISLEDIQPAVDLLESWNLKVKIGNTIGLADNQFAGTDKDRINDFQAMLDDDQINSIWCARGGYGTVRIIDALDFSKFKNSPKWIVGFSDVTVLHNHINNLGFETLHATMPLNVPKNTAEALNSLKNALFGKQLKYSMKSYGLNKKGQAKGEITGGNLSILYSLMGSETAIETEGKILFIEDLDEYLYHVDRMMQNMKRNKYFDKLNGLIVGGLSDMNDNNIPFGKTAEQIVYDVCKDFNFPICFDFPSGHLDDNRSLIFGRDVEMKIEDKISEISFLE